MQSHSRKSGHSHPVEPAFQEIGVYFILFEALGTGISCLTERLWLPLVWHGFHLFTAVELMPTVLATLVKPFGRSPVRILPATAKGHAAQVRRPGGST
jgi:hypothetical protein